MFNLYMNILGAYALEFDCFNSHKLLSVTALICLLLQTILLLDLESLYLPKVLIFMHGHTIIPCAHLFNLKIVKIYFKIKFCEKQKIFSVSIAFISMHGVHLEKHVLSVMLAIACFKFLPICHLHKFNLIQSFI